MQTFVEAFAVWKEESTSAIKAASSPLKFDNALESSMNGAAHQAFEHMRDLIDQMVQEVEADIDGLKETFKAKHESVLETKGWSRRRWLVCAPLPAAPCWCLSSLVWPQLWSQWWWRLVVARSISGSIREVIARLREGVVHVSGASDQVSVSSQQMAEGATEQASSLEEISASLEEMAAMTRQNADNAGQVDNLVSKDSAAILQRMADRMDQMGTNLETVAASEQTAKIIKTIDEIAFQTNLLGLECCC